MVALHSLGDNLLQALAVHLRLVHAALVGPYLLGARAGQDEIVFLGLQVVFEKVDIDGDEGDGAAAEPQVEQVVAQGEVEQFALPYLQTGGVAGSLLRGQVVLRLLLHAVGGMVELEPLLLPHAVDLDGEGPYALHAAAVYVERHDEVGRLAIDVPLGGLHGHFEGHIGLCEHGGLYEHQFVDAVGHRLGEETGVVAVDLRVEFLHEPTSHEHVSAAHDEQGPQPHALQHRGIEHREVGTGAHLLGQHLVGEAEALSALLEAGWRSDIDHAHAAQRLVDGGHLRPHAVGVLCLVGIERGRPGEAAQEFRRLHPHVGQFGGVGGDEGGGGLRHDTDARPLVEGQQTYLAGLGAHLFIAYHDTGGELCGGALGQVAQFVDIGGDIYLVDTDGGARRHTVYPCFGRLNEFAIQGDVHLAPVFAGVVGQFAGFNAPAAVHCHGVIEARQVTEGEEGGLRSAFFRRGRAGGV